MPLQPSPGSPTLILVSTELERRLLAELGGLEVGLGLWATCGFGPVAAAARTAELLAKLAPRRVLLLGIAGTFDLERAPLASASTFPAVSLDGVGAGTGTNFVPAAQLGYPHWSGSAGLPPDPMHERLALSGEGAGELLTVCSASSSDSEARLRRERYPRALAEDMEGFGVALTCALSGTPLVIARGFSNAVGDRDARRWKVREALAAARDLARTWLERPSWTRAT